MAAAVVEQELVAAPGDSFGAAYGTVGYGNPCASLPCSAFSTNDFQISAGKVPPATASPWNSVSIGLSVVG